MKELTAEILRELVSYDSATGEFRWRVKVSNVHAGTIAGSLKVSGYRALMVDRTLYYAHRLAWLYTYGKWPKDQIDHINGERDDNRLANLREATHAQNGRNIPWNTRNKSGFRGVSWAVRRGKRHAQINITGAVRSLGYFTTPEAASAAYEAKATELFGEFKRK